MNAEKIAELEERILRFYKHGAMICTFEEMKDLIATAKEVEQLREQNDKRGQTLHELALATGKTHKERDWLRQEMERLRAERDELCKAIDWYHQTLKDTQQLCLDNQATVSKFLEEAIAKVQK
jgi:uncharacterized coiled-coil DUF342 family protein